jgi:hypothetical protein
MLALTLEMSGFQSKPEALEREGNAGKQQKGPDEPIELPGAQAVVSRGDRECSNFRQSSRRTGPHPFG